ncbi:hypothetical protein ACIBF1_21095 [Spirillospora sp. NPDC050679]
MSYDITVYGSASPSAAPTELYGQPLGSHGTVSEYWAAPARELDLAILKGLSEGRVAVGHHQLAAFAQELDALAGHWVAAVPDGAAVTSVIGPRTFTTPLLAHLLHRLALVRAAVRIAELTGGRLEIT